MRELNCETSKIQGLVNQKATEIPIGRQEKVGKVMDELGYTDTPPPLLTGSVGEGTGDWERIIIGKNHRWFDARSGRSSVSSVSLETSRQSSSSFISSIVSRQSPSTSSSTSNTSIIIVRDQSTLKEPPPSTAPPSSSTWPDTVDKPPRRSLSCCSRPSHKQSPFPT